MSTAIVSSNLFRPILHRALLRRVHKPNFPALSQATTMATATMTKKAPQKKVGGVSKDRPLPFTPIQQRWTTLYTTDLPKLASSKSPVQGNGHWPVTVDHCFARIILDNAVGKDKPWPQVVEAPATRNMSQSQLKACVALAEQVASGEADLWALDEHSLKLRGKKPKSRTAASKAATAPHNKKRKSATDSLESSQRTVDQEDADEPATKKTRKQEAAEDWSAFSLLKSSGANPAAAYDEDVDDEAEVLADIQHIIASSPDLTPFRREALRLLTQVPRGRYTTYQAISNAMSPAVSPAAATKDKSRASGCARAVGMAMRTNPFAPTVPCHRVLASDGKIGGFKGDWGTEGRFYNEKMRLLTEEGVKFDSRGIVIGEPFRGFT